jgi:hypothetical protein
VSRARLPRWLALLVPAALLAAAFSAAHAKEPALADLRRRILEAHTSETVGAALDAVQARIGKDDELPDAGAFGDWLGKLPDGRAEHPAVVVRRGWAYVAARRGSDAVPLLEKALKDDPSQGYVRAYLGEAKRQAGDPAAALAMLATAVKAGYDAPHSRDTALQCVLGLRKSKPPKEADGLPDYAKAAAPYLAAVDDRALEATVARALLDDLAAFDTPTGARGRTWAAEAARLTLSVLAKERGVSNGAQMAIDAAAALEPVDVESGGRTLRFDLLALAYDLGKPTDREGHDHPGVLVLFAEAALREARYDLAHRLARERLAISESPAARRVLLRLPPDVGD